LADTVKKSNLLPFSFNLLNPSKLFNFTNSAHLRPEDGSLPCLDHERCFLECASGCQLCFALDEPSFLADDSGMIAERIPELKKLSRLRSI
jgi:hypothetical protein